MKTAPRVRCGHIPQVMAALRHTTIGAPEAGRLFQHRGGLPPVGCTTRTGIGAHRAPTYKPNDPGRAPIQCTPKPRHEFIDAGAE